MVGIGRPHQAATCSLANPLFGVRGERWAARPTSFAQSVPVASAEPSLASWRFIRALCERTFVTLFRYTVMEHDPARPWPVIGDVQHLEVS
jgi:hypothetical protein